MTRGTFIKRVRQVQRSADLYVPNVLLDSSPGGCDMIPSYDVASDKVEHLDHPTLVQSRKVFFRYFGCPIFL